MRIACVNQDPGISPERHKGGAVHLRAIRRALEERGAEVIAIDTPDVQRVRGSLEEASRAGGVDLVYERFSLQSSAAANFATEQGVPFVVEINAPLSRESERWRGGSVDAELLEQESAVLGMADLVLAVSTQVAEYAVERGASSPRVEVVPNGVDVERFRPRAAEDELRRSLVPGSRFALGFHGRIRPWHGTSRLVGLTRALLDRKRDVHLVLVGEGDCDLTSLPGDRVTRVAWVEHDHVGRYVATFDTLPLTHPGDEPFYFSPLKLAEAMACGVVPIVPELGDLPSRVQHEHDALLVRPDNEEDLVAAVERLIEQPELEESLSARAVISASAWGWDRIAARILAARSAAPSGSGARAQRP